MVKMIDSSGTIQTMRKEITIQLERGENLYGTLDTEDNDTLIIFVHGLSGKEKEYLYFNAAAYFPQRGADTFRFSFYPKKQGARSLSESSLTTHVHDLKKVIEYFKPEYSKVVLIGHSFGALVILKSDLSDIYKILLWDPTPECKSIESKNGEYNDALDAYILHWGMDIIVSKELIEEWKNVNVKKLVSKLQVPCKFIFAANYNKRKLWEPYFKHIKTEWDEISIEGATHEFDEEDIHEKLFTETLNWIQT